MFERSLLPPSSVKMALLGVTSRNIAVFEID
jgi:hypothetical protein